MVNRVQRCPVTGLDTIVIAGEVRRLGTLPRTKPQAYMTFRQAGIQDVPKSDWYEIDRRKQWSWILNQRSHGSCTGFGLVGGLMKARAARGLTFALLSGSYPYSFVNGGQDGGAIIHELLPVGQREGTCLDSQAGWDHIYPPYSAEAVRTAKRFRIEDAYVPEKWAELMSGIMLDYIPVFAVMVGNSFDKLDHNGVCGFDSGPGNHCIHGFGAKRLSSTGDWLLDHAGSWGTSFGQDGFGYLTERHIDGIGYQDIYMIRAALEDTEDPEPAPAGH